MEKDTKLFDESGMTLDLKSGRVRNVPAALLGWICMAVFAGYLLYSMVGGIQKRMDDITAATLKAVAAQEKLVEEVREIKNLLRNLPQRSSTRVD